MILFSFQQFFLSDDAKEKKQKTVNYVKIDFLITGSGFVALSNGTHTEDFTLKFLTFYSKIS